MKENISNNLFFTFFFASFFILYQYVSIQIILFILLLLYVLSNLIKNNKFLIGKNVKSNLFFFLIWFGFFTVFVSFSKNWAIGTIDNSRTVSSLIRMFYVGFLMFIYSNSKEKSISILKSYIIGSFIMGIVLFAFTPFSLYGVESGSEYFGSIIYQHRNSIAIAAAESILFILYLKKYYSFKHPLFLITFFLLLILCSGSRGAIVELVFFLLMYGFLNIKNKKIYKYVPIIVLSLIVIYFIGSNIPYMYDKIFGRLTNMVDTLTSGNNVDGSVYSRSLMKKVAYSIFKSHPVIGAGVDGVAAFLSYNPVNFGYKFRAVYSHCNYTELAADFGLIGLFIWYSPIFHILRKLFNKIKRYGLPNLKYLLCIFLSIIFIDAFKIPWADYIPIYSYFCILILILNTIKEENT